MVVRRCGIVPLSIDSFGRGLLGIRASFDSHAFQSPSARSYEIPPRIVTDQLASAVAGIQSDEFDPANEWVHAGDNHVPIFRNGFTYHSPVPEIECVYEPFDSRENVLVIWAGSRRDSAE